MFKKPVIVSERFLIGERVASYEMGWRLPEEDAGALVELLGRTDRRTVQWKGVRARFDDYQAEHSEAKLNLVLDELIAKMGF